MKRANLIQKTVIILLILILSLISLSSLTNLIQTSNAQEAEQQIESQNTNNATDDTADEATEIEEASEIDEMDEADLEELQTEDQEPEIQDSAALRTEFIQYTQDPGSKRVRFEMILKPNVSSDRVRVDWIISGDSVIADDFSDQVALNVTAGQEYVVPIEIIPATQSVSGSQCCISEVFGRAQIFGIEGTAVATVRKNYASNSDQEILPITEEYSQARTVNTIWGVVQIILVVIVLIGVSLVGFRYFVKWYNKDEIKAYDERHKKELQKRALGSSPVASSDSFNTRIKPWKKK